MVQLVQKLDIITFLAVANGQTFVVWELENSFAIHLHIIERRNRVAMGLDLEDIEIELP